MTPWPAAAPSRSLAATPAATPGQQPTGLPPRALPAGLPLPPPPTNLPPPPNYRDPFPLGNAAAQRYAQLQPPPEPEPESPATWLSQSFYAEARANFNSYDPGVWIGNTNVNVMGLMFWPWFGVTIWCFLLTIYFEVISPSHKEWVAMPMDAHVLMGGALGFLVVMRTDASMERWWEARCAWSTISNCCLSIGAQTAPALQGDNATEKVLGLLMAIVVATKAHLRDEKIQKDELGELMDPQLVRLLNRSANPPLQALKALSTQVRLTLPHDDPNTDTLDESKLGAALYDEVSEQIRVMNHAVGAMVKIKTTPMVYSYIATLRCFMLLWLVTFPISLIGEFSWMAAPALSLIAFLFLNVEQMAVEIEQPFGDDANDLPMEEYILELEKTLLEMVPGYEYPPDEEDEAAEVFKATPQDGWNNVSPEWRERRVIGQR